MKGNPKVIECLNRLLDNELGSIDQYFTHSSMYEDWGLNKLHEQMKEEIAEETAHADALIKRILFLEGTPDLSSRGAINIGTDTESMMKIDLVNEMKVMTDLRLAIKLCESQGDYESREILQKLLSDTESDHILWLEQQIGLIDKVGIHNYIQSQMG
jgi:bacterioferritin